MIDNLNQKLLAAYGADGDEQQHRSALRQYLRTMAFMSRRLRMFEIANHRIFKAGNVLIVPYDAHGKLTVYALQAESSQIIRQMRLPHGTLVTDELLADLTGQRGEVIDLEREIYHLEVDDTPDIQVSRLRDLARLLNRLNSCGSRHEAVYLLRFMVARLCSSSYRGITGAKNLKPEVIRVRNELVEFMNGPFASRLRLPTRILVRSISGLVSQPKVIDEVWQDTIDLSEVHVRGSAITNEIRRSTHHAMGKQTLELSRAYLEWLQTGEAQFPQSNREIPTAADEAARNNGKVLELVERIVSDLEQLLGSSQIVKRIQEWRNTYAAELLRCESTNTLDEELESLVANGIRERNRWVYLHRLRSMASKAGDGAWADEARNAFVAGLQELQKHLPDEDGFEAQQVEARARDVVEAFRGRIRSDHQDKLFAELDELVACYDGGGQFQAFERSCRLRRKLSDLAGDGVFLSQRYLLHQLDCVLEELGFFALRHVASGYLENGVSLEQCLRAVFLCAGNLDRDGLYSRELWDLSAMLVNPSDFLRAARCA